MTVDAPYKVIIVLDPQFGERLASLPPDSPVWIVGILPNRAVAERLWKQRTNQNHLKDITVFNEAVGLSAEDLFIEELDTIDLHHGAYSADPPYTVFQVVGTHLTDKIERELRQYGFEVFTPSAEGFTASRPLPA